MVLIFFFLLRNKKKPRNEPQLHSFTRVKDISDDENAFSLLILLFLIRRKVALENGVSDVSTSKCSSVGKYFMKQKNVNQSRLQSKKKFYLSFKMLSVVYNRHVILKPFCGPHNDRKTVSGPQFRNIIISFLCTHSFISKYV